jgi:hypothetical protein
MLSVLVALALLAVTATVAAAGITRLEIARAEPFAGGEEFGSAGAYVKVVGVAHGELDPDTPGNRGSVNLARAPRSSTTSGIERRTRRCSASATRPAGCRGFARRPTSS